MQNTTDAPQAEPRVEQVNVKLTASEKDDVVLVKAFDQRSEADVMRDMTVTQIRERARAIRAGEAVSLAATR